MKQLAFTRTMKGSLTCATAIALGIMSLFSSCSDENEVKPKDEDKQEKVEFSINTFPKMDSSTSTSPLMRILAAKLLGIPYEWKLDAVFSQTWDVALNYSATKYTMEEQEFLKTQLNSNGTHGAYTNLIDGKADVIVVSRDISRDEVKYAKEKGAELTTRPIGRDAFVFLVNKDNPVKGLTIEQIQKIYMGEITNWKEVGGKNATIVPFIRDANSGSQEKFETMVMDGFNVPKWKDCPLASGMAGPYYELAVEPNGIAFSPYFYYNVMARSMPRTHAIAINGIDANSDNISNGSFPYISEICVAIRNNTDKHSTAYQMFEYITTPEGQKDVKESGYVPMVNSEK